MANISLRKVGFLVLENFKILKVASSRTSTISVSKFLSLSNLLSLSFLRSRSLLLILESIHRSIARDAIPYLEILYPRKSTESCQNVHFSFGISNPASPRVLQSSTLHAQVILYSLSEDENIILIDFTSSIQQILYKKLFDVLMEQSHRSTISQRQGLKSNPSTSRRPDHEHSMLIHHFLLISSLGNEEIDEKANKV